MAKKYNKKIAPFQQEIARILNDLDLKAFQAWLQKYNKPMWNSIKKHDEEVQMGIMCKMICNRTDLSTKAHRRAIEWLKEHNMRGRMF